MMNLKERTAVILKLLCEDKKSFQTAGDLAETLGVSAKTVSRELPDVARTLETFGLALRKKKGSGLTIEGNDAAITSLKELLGQVTDHNYTPQERQSIIVSRLLPSHEPVKLFALSSLLGVTDSTISNDLDKLEGWFKGHGLELVRKPGLGVFVAGEEQSIRQAIVTYIYDNIEENELLNLVHANLTENESGNETRKQERIHIRESFLTELKTKKEFQTAGRIGAAIAEEFGIQVTEDETGYIAMHLLGARSRYRDKEVPGTVMDNFHLVRLAKAIMKTAEEKTGQQLYRNSDLLTGLVNHLGPSISRLQMQMDIRNPLLGEMKEKFPELMNLAKICVKDVEKELELIFPESEIAFIAMHLSAALIDNDMLQKLEHRIIVACPTGMGTSRLLASRLRQQYDNLIVTDLVSTLQLNPDYFAAHEAEFIVSTVPVPQVPLPVVVVSALLSKDDQQQIDEALLHCEERKVEAQASGRTKAALDFPAALRVMGAYNAAIVQLLEGFFFLEDTKSMLVRDVAREIGELTGETAGQAQAVMQALIQREDQGSTAITGCHMILLHCRSAAVTQLQFGIIHVGSWFLYPAEPAEKIRTVIVMLAPLQSSCYELETIGHISAILLERWGLIEVLHEGDKMLIQKELMHIFKTFYAKKYKELLEG